MKIVKILNNCVVLAEANGQEYVVMGNALGFHYKKGRSCLNLILIRFLSYRLMRKSLSFSSCLLKSARIFCLSHCI